MGHSVGPSDITVSSLKQIKDDLSNLCMEMRLSLEMERENNRDLLSQVNASFQSLVSKYSTLSEAYKVECARRRKVVIAGLCDG